MEGFFHLSQFHKAAPNADLSPKCGACGLWKTCAAPKMKPSGHGRARILIVGSWPSKRDEIAGVPFSSDSEAGSLLREAIGLAGCSYDDDVRVTNAIICHPGAALPQKGKEIGYCRANLLQTIREFQPKVIITLGRQALESVLARFWKSDVGQLDRWTGYRIPTEDYWICPTWHPWLVSQENNRVMSQLFTEHISAAVRMAGQPTRVPNLQDRVEKLYDEREIVRALEAFDRNGRDISFDYETNCLKPEYPKARIVSCAVSDGRRTVAYPFLGRAVKATSRLLRSPRTLKSAANMKFEDRWTIKHLGHPVARLDWDTMLGAHCLDNRSGVCSLKFQAFVLLGVPSYNEPIGPYLSEMSGSHYNRIHEISMDQLLQYNGLDAFLENRVKRIQKRQLGF